jgi:hypothetical protein
MASRAAGVLTGRLGNTLFLLRDNAAATLTFLEELTRTCDMSSASTDDVLQATVADLPSFILLLLTAQHVAHTYRDNQQRITIDPEDTLEFVEMTMMLSSENQYRIMQALSLQLMSPDTTEMAVLDNNLLDEMTLEILASRDKAR